MVPDEPMSEERLAEIETDHAMCCPITQYEDGGASQRQVHRAVWDRCDIEALIVEVRRLRSVCGRYHTTLSQVGDVLMAEIARRPP